MLKFHIISKIVVVFLWMKNIRMVEIEEVPSISCVIERYEDIQKPPKDRRSYRGLKLGNEMKVLLIHDPVPEKSAVSMVVGVGSLNDSREVPGIANLLTNLLMVASQSHSVGCEFEKIVRHSKGNVDYISTLDSQSFSFDVDPNQLADTLDRFAEFFTEPLVNDLPNEVLESYIDIIQEEYFENMQNEEFRIVEVERSVSKKNHAYYHLHNGNEETFYQHAKTIMPQKKGRNKRLVPNKVDSLKEKVRHFHSVWHSSNIMTLVVLGKESLDELEELVVPLFGKVKNENTKQVLYTLEYHPWGPEQVKNKIFVVPLSDNYRILNVNFPIPDIRTHYKSGAEVYINQMMNQQGPGSLFSVLQKKNLCRQLDADSDCHSGFGFYTISCDITSTGVERVDEILSLIFQFIQLIKEDGVQEELFKDFQMIQKILFDNYRPENIHSPLSYVTTLAADMQIYPIEDLLTHDYILDKWNPYLVRHILGYLRPDNMNVTVVSSDDAIKRIARNKEPHYRANYEVVRIPDEIIEVWKKLEPNSEFQLLQGNEAIPRNFDLFPVTSDELTIPYIIHNSFKSEIWFKQKSDTPELYVEFELIRKWTRFSPMELCLWYIIFNEQFLSSFKEYFYFATLVGFQIDVKIDDHALLIRLYGFNDTIPQLLEKLLLKLISFLNEINEESFNIFQKKYIRHYNLMTTKDHFLQCAWYTDYSQLQGSWTVQERLNAAKILRFDHAKKFIKNIFQHTFIRGLIHGNCTEQKAMVIVNLIETLFSSSRPILSQEIFRARPVELTRGSQSIFQTFNEEEGVYGFSAYFRLNPEPSDFYNAASALLNDILHAKCQSILVNQTKDPTFKVFCKLLDVFEVRGVLILMRSKTQPKSMDKKVEKFLKDILIILNDMSNDTFEKMKIDLDEAIYAEPKHLGELSKQYWYEIRFWYYKFDRRNMEREQLHLLTKADLIGFCEKMLSASSKERSKLMVYVLPKSGELNKVNNVPAGVVKSQDVTAFQNSLTLLPSSYVPSMTPQKLYTRIDVQPLRF